MPPNSLPTGQRPSREEIARIEVGHTTVTRGTAVGLMLVFLLLTCVPVIVEAVVRAGGGTDPSTAWPHLWNLPTEVQARVDDAGARRLLQRIVAANRAVLAAITGFEDALEDEAAVARHLRPPAQRLLTSWLGVGNERVYKGRAGWLFYRPDVEYVSGPAFLDPGRLADRVASADEWVETPRPDPREAIVDFHRQLQARGIVLIVMPTPVKPSVHPERLARNAAGPIENASYETFVRDLQQSGVIVFDVWAALRSRAIGSEDGLYLATDTHWRPRTMERVAAALAAAVRTHGVLPARAHPGHTWNRQQVSQAGDTAVMLDLPEGETLYPPETVELRRVVDPQGQPWRPSRDADVLVLGDSFANIYSLESMGWGNAAGLVEHLSLALGRPIDRIVQNDQGSFATRERLRQELAAGSDRLAGKRVVVYQFAARELAAGDWKLIELPPPAGP